MNAKANALESVTVNAELYFETLDQGKLNHARLIEVVKQAKTDGATQQEIADACRVGEHKLSRQRIAQLLQGE